jgi:hypothetical protein
VLKLNSGRLSETAEASAPLILHSPQTTGIAGGEWCAYSLGKVAPELPLDQRIDDAGSLVFDTPPLEEVLILTGAPVLKLTIASDKPQAFLVARLSDVAPNGAATRVSYGVLNLTHRESHEALQPLQPGKRYEVTVSLTEAAHVFAAGQRLRIAISSCYWPLIWPSPEAVMLTIWTGESEITLPHMPPAGFRALAGFAPPRHAAPAARTVLEPEIEQRHMLYDAETDKTVIRNSRNDGRTRIDDIGTIGAYGKVKEFTITGNDPLSAETVVSVFTHFQRADWDARLETRIRMTCDRAHFILHSDVDAYAGGERFFSRSFEHRIARDQI